jgi:acyl-CoA synthetase (AMP-forming)/AMP-acid ligase II
MNWITKKFLEYQNRVACHEGGRAWTYLELVGLIAKAVDELPNEGRSVIPIESRTTIEGLATLFACAECGHIALPLPMEIPHAERAQMAQVAESAELYDELAGSGLVLFSSGTSGQPKGMLHNLDALLNRYKKLRQREHRCLLLLLIDHIGGLDTAFRCLFAGSTLVIPKDRTPEAAVAAIAEHKANVLPASPTFLNLLLLSELASKYDLSSVEIIAYGAEAMPEGVLMRLREAFPNADLQQKFGTSETGAVRIQSANNDSLFFRITDKDTEWKVVDNVLWLKTPSRIIGYLNAKSDSLEADGWYATGDLVETNDTGDLRIIGRESAIINIGGQKVHPSEVEATINEIAGVDSVRVYGQEDPITGNTVACEIVSREEKSPLEWKRAIRSHCRGKLAPWKLPTSVRVSKRLGITHRMKQP